MERGNKVLRLPVDSLDSNCQARQLDSLDTVSTVAVKLDSLDTLNPTCIYLNVQEIWSVVEHGPRAKKG